MIKQKLYLNEILDCKLTCMLIIETPMIWSMHKYKINKN